MFELGILNNQGDVEVQCQSKSQQASMREARLPKKPHCWHTPENSILTLRMQLPCIPQAPYLPWFLGISYTICSSVTLHSGCCSSIFFSKRGSVSQGFCGNIFPLLLCSLTRILLFLWPGNTTASPVVLLQQVLSWEGATTGMRITPASAFLFCRFQFIFKKTHMVKQVAVTQ